MCIRDSHTSFLKDAPSSFATDAIYLLEVDEETGFIYVGTSDYTTNGTSAILGPLAAGIIWGFSYALLVRTSANSGGTDFIAAIIHKRKPEQNMFYLIFALNVAVAVLSYFVYDYKIEPVLMCILYCYFSSEVRGSMDRKYKSAVRCEIITENPQELCEAVIHKLHHTATVYPAKGSFSGREKSVLVCVVNPSQVTELTRLVAKFPDSFVTLSQVSSVIGWLSFG